MVVCNDLWINEFQGPGGNESNSCFFHWAWISLMTLLFKEKRLECAHILSIFFFKIIYVNGDDNDNRRWSTFGANLATSEFPPALKPEYRIKTWCSAHFLQHNQQKKFLLLWQKIRLIFACGKEVLITVSDHAKKQFWIYTILQTKIFLLQRISFII